MQTLGLYSRALSCLKPERKLTGFLIGASLLVSALNVAQALLFGWTLQVLTQSQGVFTLVLIFAALALMALGLQMGLTQQADRLAHRARAKAMAQFFETALTQSQHAARLSDVMQRGSDQLYLLILSFFREHLLAVFSIALILPVALWLSPVMTLLLGLELALFAALNFYLTRRALEKQDEVEKFHTHAASRAADVIGNAQIVQAYTRIEAETRGLDEAMQKLLIQQYPALDWFARKSVVFNACLALALISILALGGYLYGETQIGLFEIVSFTGLSLLLFTRANTLTGFANALFFKTRSLNDFFTLLDAEAIIKEAPGAKALNLRKGQVEFRNVSYGGISNFNLALAPHETIAVIDASGDASLLGSLLLRSIDPQSGQILIDNQDIAGVTLASLRQGIALAGGQPLLPNRTIMENLTLGKPNAAQDEVITAVQKAGAHDFIGAKADGFHTLVKESALNEAEAERLNIARAILKNAPLVIIDETQANAEDDMGDALAQLLQGRTALIFPRRLSTLQKAARIVVLNNGATEESGTYDELVQKKGTLAKMVSEGRFTSAKVTQLSTQQKKRAATGGE
jgi:ABC-type multidrug transport system fused ATPase/permease subunit